MPYPGGKAGAGVYQRIINLFPPHRVYIEPFLGGAAIMLRKRPARLNIGIDADPAVIAQASIAGIDEGSEYRFHIGDGITFLQECPFDGNELVYCDPPYMASTRRGGRRPLYRHEMMDESSHVRLLEVVRSLPCAVVVSGYWSELYADSLAGWQVETFSAATRRGQAREYLWMNFQPGAARHEYTYLGDDFRQRERIKRKRRRWIGRLEKMETAERECLLSAIEDWRSAQSSSFSSSA
jgi:hypothetical protein